MDLNEAIYHRRSVRRYRDQEIEPATIAGLLDAAVQAPSALNQQPWAFGVYHGRRRLRGYSERAKIHLVETLPPLFEMDMRSQLYETPDYDLFHGADTVVVIYAAPGRLRPAEDCCLAAENFMLAAHAVGLGTCAIGFARSWFNLPEIKNELGVPDELMAVFPMVIGHPAGGTVPALAPRRAPNIVSWKWDNDDELRPGSRP